MSTVTTYIQQINRKIIGLFALATVVAFTIVSCGGAQTQGESSQQGISPENAVDYIHTVLLADRTAYTRHVVNRLQMLEGNENAEGVVPAEATEDWQENNGVPLPAQMFRLGSEIASGSGAFTYGLISPWNINDNQAPQPGFEEEAMAEVVETGEPYKDYQEIGGQRYYSAVYPDEAVAEACVNCHNSHPVHQERYPDKQFEMGDVMGGIVINLPVNDG